jgi:hypothetical protein
MQRQRNKKLIKETITPNKVDAMRIIIILSSSPLLNKKAKVDSKKIINVTVFILPFIDRIFSGNTFMTSSSLSQR